VVLPQLSVVCHVLWFTVYIIKVIVPSAVSRQMSTNACGCVIFANVSCDSYTNPDARTLKQCSTMSNGVSDADASSVAACAEEVGVGHLSKRRRAVPAEVLCVSKWRVSLQSEVPF